MNEIQAIRQNNKRRNIEIIRNNYKKIQKTFAEIKVLREQLLKQDKE